MAEADAARLGRSAIAERLIGIVSSRPCAHSSGSTARWGAGSARSATGRSAGLCCSCTSSPAARGRWPNSAPRWACPAPVSPPGSRRPLDYLQRWRIHAAGRVLRDGDRTVASVAAEFGYASESAFSNAFKRVTGVPPAGQEHRLPQPA